MATAERIRELLDEASALADELASSETSSTEPFTVLAQQIDFALARVEALAQ